MTKEKKYVYVMLLLSIVLLLVGIAVAYYNTASFGYDNANILTYNEESIRIFDILIVYDDIFEIIEKLFAFVPKNFITI